MVLQQAQNWKLLEIMQRKMILSSLVILVPAPSLAIEGDNIFRFVPDDLHQAESISRVMWDQGIRMVIPFYRDDIYGRELMQVVRANFQKLGGEFDKDSEKIGYAPRTGHLEQVYT